MGTPAADFLDFIHSDDGPQESSNGSAGRTKDCLRQNPHLLVTQMALLLYLGEYTHARHLWRRQRRAPSLPGEDNTKNGNASSDGEYAQLGLLWNAVKYCYLWSTGGIHPLGSGRLPSPEGSTNNMQVETEDSKSENGDNLPFSTLALRALYACHSSGMEHLSKYSGELLGVFRSRVNRRLHQSFDKLDSIEFCIRMNLEGELWNAFGWKKEGNFLISDENIDSDNEVGDILADFVEKEEDRIGKLTDIVMFFEGKMNAG